MKGESHDYHNQQHSERRPAPPRLRPALRLTDGNPNGDPDAGNLPRVDPETMQGLVTDVCLKRKVRDWVLTVKEGKPPFDIYVKHRGILSELQQEAFKAVGAKPSRGPNEDARREMCKRYYDVRIFGAVMTVGEAERDASNRRLFWNCGQVRGPIQLTFARSVDKITPLDLSITRVALTTPKESERGDEEEEQAPYGTMGRKAIVPYALYVGYGFFSPSFAQATGVSADDLALFWQALAQMWELDRSASRGLMACRGLYVFSHENRLGNAPAHVLFSRVAVEKKAGVEAPRRFEDYEVKVDDSNLPQGVTLTRLVG